MATRSCLAIILAAGEGARMKSATPKVLHTIGGRPDARARARRGIGGRWRPRIAVVVGPGAETVTAFVGKTAPAATVHVQAERLGTAHAVLAARGRGDHRRI